MLKQIKPGLLEKTENYVKATIYNRVVQPNTPSYALSWNTAQNTFLSIYISIHMYPQMRFTVIAINVPVKSLSR